VAAQSQKQVMMFERKNVAVSLAYRTIIPFESEREELRIQRLLKTRNRKEEGLGLPLPGGNLVLFAGGRARPLLIGEGGLRDRAIAEDVEVEIGPSPALFGSVVEQEEDEDDKDEKYDYSNYLLTLGNSSDQAVRIEAEFQVPRPCVPVREGEDDSNDYCDDEAAELVMAKQMRKRDGKIVWDVSIPAGGKRSLAYRVRELD
jgi:hypothetical protein